MKSESKSTKQEDHITISKKRNLEQSEAQQLEDEMSLWSLESAQKALPGKRRKKGSDNPAMEVASLAGKSTKSSVKSSASTMIKMLIDTHTKVLTSHVIVKKEKLAAHIAKELAGSARQLEHMRRGIQQAISKGMEDEDLKTKVLTGAETIKAAKHLLTLAKPHEKSG